LVYLKKAYEPVIKEMLYNILNEIGITTKLVRLIKICLNAAYSRVTVGKHLSDTFAIKINLKQDDLSRLLFNFALEYAVRRVQAKRRV
jgi:hypothetical protein